MSKYKKQHYVPQIYLEAWNDESGKIRLYDKLDNKLCRYSKTEKVLYELDLYTKTVEDNVILTNEDKEKIFKCLNGYRVIYDNGEECILLDNVDKQSIYYYGFDKWSIYRNDGTLVKKKPLKDEIEKVRITIIEESWKMVENGWRELRDEIQFKIRNGECISRENLNDLLKFIVSQKWRTLHGLETCKGYIAKILEVVKDEMGEFYEKEVEDMGKTLFKNELLRFMNSDDSTFIAKELEMYKKLHIVFFKPIGSKFFTSDNPVLQIVGNDFMKGNYNGIYMPITPELMIGLFRGDNKKYTVSTLRNNIVRKFNTKIKNNSIKYYISDYNLFKE